MTLDHAILTGTLTTYIFIGSYLKDRRLEFYLGDTYREYATRVPGYPFLLVGPLGRWSLSSNSTTPQSEQAVPWREVA